MFDSETTALLRAVLDELCGDLPQFETSARTCVASKILETAMKDGWSLDDLKEAGSKTLHGTPTMWR